VRLDPVAPDLGVSAAWRICESEHEQPDPDGFGREQAAGGRGWKAYVTTDEDEPAETVVYCLDAVFARRGAARPRAADREQR
jgi:hypothetical protein